ncbi:MAG: peptide MFS transporter [Bradymonadales bacterium]
MNPDANVTPEEIKHPLGLKYLFLTEAMERFSYYGMRAILVLYLTKQLEFPREQALSVYAVYTSLVYLTPLLGGFLADKYLGSRKAIFIGGFVMMLGEFSLMFSGMSHSPFLLNLGLGLLIIGNGFFKPNISTIVGSLYEDGDPRRDSAFTIFYMGINVGAFFSPLVCGTLGEGIGFEYGFAAAAVGMLIGVVIFMLGQKSFGTAGFPPSRKNLDSDSKLLPIDWVHISGASIGLVALVLGVVFFLDPIMSAWSAIHPTVKLVLGIALLLAASGSLFGIAAKGGGAADVKSVAAILILSIFVVFFWVGFEQAGGTMTLFAEAETDRYINLGFWSGEIPASYFQSVNPIFIVTLAPIFSMLWFKVDSSKYKISVAIKMAIGLLLLGAGFVLLFAGRGQVDLEAGIKASPFFLVGVYFLHTTGELCLSPIGLSLVTKLSPPRMVSLMMGIWFLSSAAANFFAGKLEAYLKDYDIDLYFFLLCTSFGAGVTLLLISPLLKRWMKGN